MYTYIEMMGDTGITEQTAIEAFKEKAVWFTRHLKNLGKHTKHFKANELYFQITYGGEDAEIDVSKDPVAGITYCDTDFNLDVLLTEPEVGFFIGEHPVFFEDAQ